MLDETLRMHATLYRSARRATFDSKPTLIRVLDHSGGPYSPPTVLGSADFDLSEHAEHFMNADSPPRNKTLRLPRALVRRGDPQGDALITLQLSIRATWLQGEGAGGSLGSALPATTLDVEVDVAGEICEPPAQLKVTLHDRLEAKVKVCNAPPWRTPDSNPNMNTLITELV